MAHNNYAAWNIDEKKFPHEGTIADKLRFITGYGVLAPSTHNTQPWLFQIRHDTLRILPNKELFLPQADPTNRNLYISLGACAANIMVAAYHFGMRLSYRVIDSGAMDSAIFFELIDEAGSGKNWAPLFPYLKKRYSNKSTARFIAIPDEKLEQLKSIDTGYAGLRILPSDEKIADLYYRAASSYSGNRDFGKELSAWLTGNRTRRHDGMPGFTSGLSNGKALAGKLLTKYVPQSIRILARKYYWLVKESPMTGVIATNSNTVVDWVEAGILFERLALQATSISISATPLAAVIESENHRKLLADYFDVPADSMQLFFRLTVTTGKIRHTPRRAPRFL